MQMEVKKMMHQYVAGYNQENFELRDRLMDATSSCQVMIYPRYMFVNKTSMRVISERQQFQPYQNDYLNTDIEKEVISIKIPGYSSQDIDVTTIGLSGVLTFDVDSKSEVLVECLPQRDYIPSKLEFGLIISQAPTPFNKTTLLTLVPRYIVINQLEAPIVLK